jgi:hypothetical protein
MAEVEDASLFLFRLRITSSVDAEAHCAFFQMKSWVRAVAATNTKRRCSLLRARKREAGRVELRLAIRSFGVEP